MTFIDVYTADQINQLSSHGLIGLGPASISGKYKTIIQEMFERGLIEKNMFSLHLGLLEHDSKIWFGGYDRSQIVHQALRDDPDGDYGSMTGAQLDNLIKWFPLSYKAYWSTNLDKAMLGNINLEVSAENLIFDSGSSLNHVPVREFNRIIQTITADHTCEPHMRPSTTYYCECESVEDPSFPTMQIHAKGNIFNFKPRDYLILE